MLCFPVNFFPARPFFRIRWQAGCVHDAGSVQFIPVKFFPACPFFRIRWQAGRVHDAEAVQCLPVKFFPARPFFRIRWQAGRFMMQGGAVFPCEFLSRVSVISY